MDGAHPDQNLNVERLVARVVQMARTRPTCASRATCATCATFHRRKGRESPPAAINSCGAFVGLCGGLCR